MATLPGKSRTSGWFRSRWFWLFLIAIVLLIGGRLGFRQYREWRVANLVSTARVAFEKGQLREASLALKQALAARPHHLEACRMMAELTDQLQLPQSVYWHRRVAEIEPAETNYVRWVRAALQQEEPALAEEALLALARTGATNAVYHHLRASLALATQDATLAEQEAALAAVMAPQNSLYALNLAVVRMGSTNVALRTEARATLERLSASGGQQIPAARALMMVELSAGNFPAAKKLSEKIVSAPDASFSDRLQHLQLLSRMGDASADAYLARLKTNIMDSPAQVMRLVDWLVSQKRDAEAWAWLQTFSPEMRLEVPVQMAAVNCLVSRQDWSGLNDYLRDESWEQMEFLRQAYVARAQRELGNRSQSDLAWNRAVSMAIKNPETLRLLVRTVSSWDWPDETRDLLWMIARSDRSPKTALYALYRYYQAGRDTQGLFRVLQRLVEVEPADDVARNNLVAISLLLNINVEGSAKSAAELHGRHPENSAFASTHAFALLLTGRAEEARTIMSGLDDSLLKNPAIAAYHGLILAEIGQKAEALRYLELAREARLLPEEEALLAAAKAKMSALPAPSQE